MRIVMGGLRKKGGGKYRERKYPCDQSPFFAFFIREFSVATSHSVTATDRSRRTETRFRAISANPKTVLF
jgi:hypothetical protein